MHNCICIVNTTQSSFSCIKLMNYFNIKSELQDARGKDATQFRERLLMLAFTCRVNSVNCNLQNSFTNPFPDTLFLYPYLINIKSRRPGPNCQTLTGLSVCKISEKWQKFKEFTFTPFFIIISLAPHTHTNQSDFYLKYTASTKLKCSVPTCRYEILLRIETITLHQGQIMVVLSSYRLHFLELFVTIRLSKVVHVAGIPCYAWFEHKDKNFWLK